MLTAAQWTFSKTQCLTVGQVGPTGPTGPRGPSGPAGSNGISYGSGPMGQTGPTGPSGARGPDGAANSTIAPNRTAEISLPRTRSYAITADRTIPIYSNDRYHTILLNPTVSGPTIRLDPAEIQAAGGSVSNFWVTLKNTSTRDITVNERTLASSEQDIFMSNSSSLPIVIGRNPGSDQPGSSVILYYDDSSIFGYGFGRFVFV